MRKIKFRGRDFARLWHIGDLIHNDDDLLIRNGCLNTYIENETVGQFTEMLDKNGKEIYEGDIIQFQFTQFPSCSSKLFLSEQFIGIITIDKWNNHIIKSNGLEIHISNACEYGVIVGNIHDNPELLEGGNNED